jgi:hypothetical protein
MNTDIHRAIVSDEIATYQRDGVAERFVPRVNS